MTDGNTDTELDWFGPDTATFGDRVAAAREAAGMTQSQLARRLGVKKATLQAWEDDMAEPRANKLQMLSGLLNVSIPWLLTGEGEGMHAPPEEGEVRQDCREVLDELREVRTEMRANVDRVARLEKKLRRLLSEQKQ